MHYVSEEMKRSLKQKYGFTLFEIMVVVAIIGFIMVIVLPNYISAKARAVTNSCISNQKTIFTAANIYMMRESDTLESKTRAEKLQALVDNNYLRGSGWAECPASDDNDNDDYEIIFENGVVSDVECAEKPDEHVWP